MQHIAGDIAAKEYRDVTVSISGQNDRRASLDAYQPTPAPPPNSGDAWDSIVGPSAPAASTASSSAAPSGTSGALSAGLSLALIAFGGWKGGTAAAAPAVGQSSGTVDPGSIALASATAGAAAQPPGPPPFGGNDSSSAETNTPVGAPDGTPSRWKPGYSDGFQQRFALSAYGANAASGLDGPVATSVANINV